MLPAATPAAGTVTASDFAPQVATPMFLTYAGPTVIARLATSPPLPIA